MSRKLLCAIALSVLPALLAPSSQAAGLPVAGAELWLDATDTGTLFQAADKTNPVSTAGQAVRAWADKSGNANDATTTAAAPTYQTGVIGGQDVVRFNRSQLTVFGGIDVPANQDRTAFLVMSYTTQTQNNEVFGPSTGSMIDVGTWPPGRQWSLRIRQGENLFSANNTVPSGANLLALLGDAAGTKASRNGTGVIDSADKRFHWGMNANLGIGGATFSGREYIGDLAEVVVYPRALNRYEQNSVGHYLQEKYGLAGTYADVSLPIQSGLELWLDSADAGTVTVDAGGKVTVWADKSGNGHDATPRSGRPGPTWVPDAIAALPAIEFDQASRNVMDIAGDLGIGANADRTLFIVMDYDEVLPNNEVLGNSTGQMVDVGSWTDTGHKDNRLRLRDGGLNLFSDPGDLPFGAQILVVQGWAGGTLAVRNGYGLIDDPQKAFHYAMTTEFKIGGTDFDGRDFEGRIAEILLYDRALTHAEIALVGDYLGRKYFLPTAFVPEPVTLALLGAGAIGLAGYVRRRRA